MTRCWNRWIISSNAGARSLVAACVAASLGIGAAVAEAAAPVAKAIGNRRVEVVADGEKATFEIAPATWKTVVDEKIGPVPTYNPSAAPWASGRVLQGVDACECAVAGALDPASVEVKLEATGEKLERGKDFEFNDVWSALGRLDGGKIAPDAAILVSYRCVESRIDAIVRAADGSTKLVRGEPLVLSPVAPAIGKGETRLVDVYTTGRSDELTDAAVFPVDEAFAKIDIADAKAFCESVDVYNAEIGAPEPANVSTVGAAKKFLPKTWAKLVAGEEVRVLAWGDSVTACGFLPDDQRWQVKFVNRLQAMFPKAKITLISNGWGGRNSDSFRAEPSGSKFNYRETVLDVGADLIVSEFVNDAGMSEETVARRYGEMLNDFKAVGSEWVILGPHFVRPDWMGLASEKAADADPRPYVKGIREFAAANGVPLADAPSLYARLGRAGIPYLTLMTNNINHPNDFGMELFAASLARLFEE